MKQVEKGVSFERLFREKIFAQVCALLKITFCTQCGKRTIQYFGQCKLIIRLKSFFFWVLHYCHTLFIHHNLNVINTERNVFENEFNTLMNVKDKIKDG